MIFPPLGLTVYEFMLGLGTKVTLLPALALGGNVMYMLFAPTITVSDTDTVVLALATTTEVVTTLPQLSVPDPLVVNTCPLEPPVIVMLPMGPRLLVPFTVRLAEGVVVPTRMFPPK